MNAEDLPGYYRRDREAVESVDKMLPDIDIITPLTLVIEARHSTNAFALVVAPKQEDILRVFDFIA
jgi:hypothetical protein